MAALTGRGWNSITGPNQRFAAPKPPWRRLDGPGTVTAAAESDGVISWLATTAPAGTSTVTTAARIVRLRPRGRDAAGIGVDVIGGHREPSRDRQTRPDARAELDGLGPERCRVLCISQSADHRVLVS